MKQEQPWLRRKWKLIVNIVTFFALALLVYLTRHQVGSTIKNIGQVRAWVLLLLIPIEALNYHAQAKIYQRLFEIVGNKIDYKFLYRASLELNFVNHVFPSGGVTGLSYFTLRLRKGKELSSGKATLIHITKISLYIFAYELLLIFGVLALAFKGHANNLVMLTAGSLSTLLVVGSFIFVYIVGSKTRIDTFFTAMTKLINRIIRLVRPSHPETISINSARGLFHDFHNSYEEIKSKYSRLKSPLMYSLLADATEIMAVYIVYVAFDKLVNIGAVILAYGIANFAGLISVMPGGFGIYEGLMTAALASTGIPPGTSLPITVTYRLLNTVIQVPPGYYLYQRTLKKGGQPPVEQIS
jgi:uncharacterized protein (TIRG00374 family)